MTMIAFSNKEQTVSDSYIVDGKEIDILQESWDVLIILDACRYDFFQNIYRDVIGDIGTLKKAISPSTSTGDWFHKIFKDFYFEDMIYVSANPVINSKGITSTYGKYELVKKKVFKKIVDVWNRSWDDTLNTVHPAEATKATMVNMDIHRNSRFIIHYVQPHAPFICYSTIKGEPLGFVRQKILGDQSPPKKYKTWKKVFGRFAKKYLTHETQLKLSKFFGIEPGWYYSKLFYKFGRSGIRAGYKNNLELVLQQVKLLLKTYPKKKFLITADHGERLGDHGNYGHGGRRDKEVTEVPWFEIN